MNKKFVAGVAGILIAIAAAGFAFGSTPGRAAGVSEQPPMMMQPGQIDSKAMAEMMKSPQMQEQCIGMMKSTEMQQAMVNMMKQPEMQAAMKQMLRTDAGFRQMMLELVNSVDKSGEPGKATSNDQTPRPPAASGQDSGHASHHQ